MACQTKNILPGRAPAAALDDTTGGAMPLVLMYHSVTVYEQDPYLVTVSPQRFEQQMRWLRRRGLQGTSMGELLTACRDGSARGLVGLTFDDGYVDFAQHVLPALKRHSFTATVFVIAGRLGGDNAWDTEGPRKALMTAKQVRQVADMGMEIGSHGLRHVSLPSTGDEALTEETERSRRLLQDISGQQVRGFCYPYGHIDRRLADSVKAAGYDYGCAIWPSEITGRYALPRTYIGDGDHGIRLRAKWICHHLAWDYRGPGARRLRARLPGAAGPSGASLAGQSG